MVKLETELKLGHCKGELREYGQAFETVGSGSTVMASALDLVVDHGLQLWDGLILSASAEAGAAQLLSEDRQDGFVLRGLTIVNPHADIVHLKPAAIIPEVR